MSPDWTPSSWTMSPDWRRDPGLEPPCRSHRRAGRGQLQAMACSTPSGDKARSEPSWACPALLAF
eukprot:543258-Alexandrium_andersonii.AAC.1